MSMMDEALKYAKMGLAVFPVRQNKAPYTPNGCKDAKTSERSIKSWWKRWPDANIGIATGSISGGIIVIDVDIDEEKCVYGDESLRDWEKEHGDLPDTWRAITGRGGYHIYYRSDEKVSNATGIYSGIDIRGEGGYVIAPPSVHQNGNNYQWEIAPDDMDIHFADQQVMDFIHKTKKEEDKPHFTLPDVIPVGKRNDILFRFGCSLQAKGKKDDYIRQALIDANKRCEEELEDKELETIIKSALSKEKGIPYMPDENMPAEWRAPVIDKNDDGKVIQKINNMVEAIKYDPWLYKKIRKNELAYSPYVFGSVPWDQKNVVREWNNEDDSNLKNYIENKYGLKPTDKIMDALVIVAGENSYNPVTDMLEQRHLQWDGEKHIENLLPDYLGVEKTRYTTEVLKLFMLGAITRAYNPGCKFDYVPIIYGQQGCGKSTFCRLLAVSNEWYDDNFNTIEGDKAAEKLRGLWMAEFAELLATKKARELESIKSFITSRDDNYRPPYARRTEHRKRVCVFIGTTNSEHFLTDRTGNRRFLPLVADRNAAKSPITLPENYNNAIIDINNAWGEAMELFIQANRKPVLVLPSDLDSTVLEMQKKFLEDNPQTGQIQEYLDKCTHDKVCVQEIWEKALHNIGNPSRKECNDIHTLMQLEIVGWYKLDKRQRCGEYGKQTCYAKEQKGYEEVNDVNSPFDTV